ncbi:hypothetical protein RchiOBHm_Chr5g0064431 [Rosa chinensis]|uniref:Uncharacterized protein n=1 Tax=Rosa chinensis TaxID=74649 RepID=A0A2P6QIN4_ROSCH|nr:hypothetical protein RchiOBHm_Chr5g0064431 [Rosa chinensis]
MPRFHKLLNKSQTDGPFGYYNWAFECVISSHAITAHCDPAQSSNPQSHGGCSVLLLVAALLILIPSLASNFRLTHFTSLSDANCSKPQSYLLSNLTATQKQAIQI